MAGREVQLPSYDFRSGTRQLGETLRIGPQHVIIAEGIHGMNPELVPDIPPDRMYRVYISALTQLNIDKHNRVPTTDTRLLRRIVRDAAHRGYSAGDAAAPAGEALVRAVRGAVRRTSGRSGVCSTAPGPGSMPTEPVCTSNC